MTPDMHNNYIKTFDDNETLKTAKAFHIEKVIVFYGKFICGISVIYKLDGKNRKIEHLGKDAEEYANHEKLDLEEFEHIELVKCTYSQRGLHSISLSTNTGKKLLCEGIVGKG